MKDLLTCLPIASVVFFACTRAEAYRGNVTTPHDEFFSDQLERIFNADLNRHWSPEDEKNAQNLHQTFDFIIIGSGSAGSVIANRLTENPNWNVLLIEAGKVPTDELDVPMFQNYFIFTDYNWGYLMEKQANVGLGLENQRMHWPRGRALGGTTEINAMLHVRGNRLDYDRWAAAGNKGWSYKDVLPYFEKSEDYLVKIQDEEYHHKGGYLGVQDVNFRTESSYAFVNAMRESGYKYVDYNGRQQMGVSFMHATQRNGRRASGYNAFLEPIASRKNLKILTETRAVKMLIDPTSKKAYGVHFVRDGKNYVVRTSKEVILSAGVLSSPQLLMLSGVGPKEHLEKMGIPVVQDLPVGRKLYDHLTFSGMVFTVNETITFDASTLQAAQTYTEFIDKGAGPLTLTNVIEAIGFIRTPVSKDPDPTYPDVELLFAGGGYHTDRGAAFRRVYRISDATYDAFWRPLEGKQAFTIFPMLYHPESSGRVELKSKNPFSWPRFYGEYFTDPDNYDVKRFIAAIRFIQRLARTPAFRRYNATLWKTPMPGCEDRRFDSDSYWECCLRQVAVTLHHQVGTCKMGPRTDPEAVVDADLRVHGVKNLRVADTGVIPRPLSAHTSVPGFMIGEKASDIIKLFWSHR